MTKENKNVFRDEKFGDKFLTRNGQVLIYQKQAREDVYCLFDEESDCVVEYRPNGDVIHEYTGNVEPQEDDIVKKYVQPSLPANLDDVKLDISDIVDCGYKGIAEYFYNRGKRDGAEWMAGQGYTKEGIARPDDCEIWINFTDTDIRDGDEVIVQIRKK